MTLLELITKASANPEIILASESDYPIILNPDESLLNLEPQLKEGLNPNFLIQPVTGFQISRIDAEIIDWGQKFLKKLKRKLKNPHNFGADDFLGILNAFFEKIGKKVGISIGVDPSDNGYTCKLIEKVGFFMGREVVRLVLEACVVLEIWEVLETLIVHGLVEHSCYSNLVNSLVTKRKSDLLCVCVKHFSDLPSSDFLCVLKYFLSTPKGAYSSMVAVKKEWESEALLAIEKATDKSLKGKKIRMANDASILLMIAYDGFSVSELCLHYLIASMSLDELILTSAISKLNGVEIMALIQYLGKWLNKYERFPQAGPCPKASSMLGLKTCEWVPTVEDIVKCIGLVLDEHFSSLVLHPEFREVLRSIQGTVNSLALETRLCCSMANVIENLRTEVKG
ncbi:hypothetical protein L1049_027786 [Liquidambar formosana]|uniref:Uncharacterized protein n=1 Tax=Liquidambar formosana TaxID=63359 RepID=A0AAP0RIS0_LIQFO